MLSIIIVFQQTSKLTVLIVTSEPYLRLTRSLADASVSTQQQCIYEGPYVRNETSATDEKLFNHRQRLCCPWLY